MDQGSIRVPLKGSIIRPGILGRRLSRGSFSLRIPSKGFL